MIKMINTGLVALIAAGSMAATASPAAAEEHWGHDGGWGRGDGERWEHRGGGDGAALIAGGIAGLALGAALSSHNNGYGGGYYHNGYNGGYYGNGYGGGYYGNGYGGGYYGNGYGYRSRICVQRTRVWDPYEEEDVVRETRYRC